MKLRKNILKNMNHKSNLKSLTSAMDAVDYLQEYIHDFEDWDGESALPTTFTPLIINDVDVTEIIVYDTVGQPAILDVSDDEWEPDYPVAVVGLNEGALLMQGGFEKSCSLSKLTSVSTSEGIFLKKICVRKVRSLEPWIKGKAEMVVRQVDSDCATNAPVRNKGKEAKKCKYKRCGQPCFWNGTLRGHVQLTDTETRVTFEVFEADMLENDWVIDEATVSYPSWTITVTDEGEYYRCGNYIRCSYDWSWGSDASYIYDCMGGN